MEKEIEENIVPIESEQASKLPFWQKPKFPLYLAAAVVGLTFVSSAVLVLLESQISRPGGDLDKGGAVPSTAKKEVTITTDKTKYEQGEKEIKVTVENNLGRPIWYGRECGRFPFSVFRVEEKGLKPLEQISPIECFPPSTVKLEANSTKNWKVRGANFRTKEGDFLLDNSGTYKTGFSYFLDERKKKSREVYSNEFRIREEPIGQRDPRCLMSKPTEIGVCEIL